MTDPANTRERMIQLYADGYTLQEVADRVGCCREWVRQHLMHAGIARRHSIANAAPRPGELAMEVFDDLDDRFPDGATVEELSDWIGEAAAALRRALGELITAGWATIRDGRYHAHTAVRPIREETPRRPPAPARVFPCVAGYGSRSLRVLEALNGSTKGLRQLAAELDHHPDHLRSVLAGLNNRGFIRAVGKDSSVPWRAYLWTITPEGAAHAGHSSERVAA